MSSLPPPQRKSIEIPCRDGSEVVEVFLDELPEDASELCEILLMEAAPFDLFHVFAVHVSLCVCVCFDCS